ncbi:MAG: hypothetical protein A2X94_00555 [Bdellovibrionales bacterium GWB1_55_8]|nr:MAG: hypothetical protein A2X94_00555 [Bdellovibrionales bacterium GWB1_55_8]
MREKYSGIPAVFGLCLGLLLVGCEQEANVGNDTDWIHTPAPTESPAPTPTATPTPAPTVTPTPAPTTGQLYTGPAELAKYVNKFVDDAKIQGVDVLPDMKNPTLEIRIASLDSYGSSVIGLCETGTNQRRVTFDPDFWNSVSETQRELLAHHELGHCVLYRGHRTTTLTTGAYASIMYPIIMGSSMYTSDYDYYQEELFTYGATAATAATGETTVHVCDHAQ